MTSAKATTATASRLELHLRRGGARPGLGDLGEDGALLRGEAADGLDEVGDEIGAALVDVLNLRPLLVDVLLGADEIVVDADAPHDADAADEDADDEEQHDQQDDVFHGAGI